MDAKTTVRASKKKEKKSYWELGHPTAAVRRRAASSGSGRVERAADREAVGGGTVTSGVARESCGDGDTDGRPAGACMYISARHVLTSSIHRSAVALLGMRMHGSASWIGY